MWNGTALGTRGVCVASGVVILLWDIERIGHRVLRRVRAARRSAPATAGDAALVTSPSKWNDRIAWGVLGAAGLFAVASAVTHDYQLGEPAGVYARGVVREAGDRIVVLNGVADEQVLEELRMENGKWKIEKGKWKMGETGALSYISSERGYRPKSFTAQVKAEWPE